MVATVPAALAAYDDPTRHRVWQWGRGSTKTTTAQAWLLELALQYPDVAVIYMLNTAIRAKAVAWPDFKKWNREQQLRGKTNDTDLTLTLDNGSRVFVTGADRMDLFDRKRGIKRVIGVGLGEAQDWDPETLEYAVTKVFAPRLGDMEASHGIKGRMVIEGTGTYKHGFFYRAATDDKELGEPLGFGNKHRLTQWDNPHIADPDGEFVAACKLSGVRFWKLAEPIYNLPTSKPRWYDTDDELTRREWFADNNEGSSDLKIFKKITTCRRDELPTGPADMLVTGGDYGTVDAMATASWPVWQSLPWVPLCETNREFGLGNSGMVRSHRQAAHEAAKKYGVRDENLYLVGDGGGLGKGLVMDIAEAEDAADVDAIEKKLPKAVYARQFASDLAIGTLRICEDEKELIAELKKLEWDPQKPGERIRGHVPDRVDAAMYGGRKAKSLHLYEPPPPEEDPDVVLERRIQAGLRYVKDDNPYAD